MVEPIHLQNALIRVEEVAKIQNVCERTSELQGVAFSQELKRQAERVSEEVISPPKKERLKQRKGGNQNQGEQKKQLEKVDKKTKGASNISSLEDEQGQFLDVKV